MSDYNFTDTTSNSIKEQEPKYEAKLDSYYTKKN